MSKIKLKCKKCRCENTFNPKKSELYWYSCPYTFQSDAGVSFTCDTCKSWTLHTIDSDLTLTEFAVIEDKIKKYKKTQTWTYKSLHFLKNFVTKLMKMKLVVK